MYIFVYTIIICIYNFLQRKNNAFAYKMKLTLWSQ